MSANTEMLTDPRATFERAMSVTIDVVAAVQADQLDDPTPCPEFDVRGLLGHIVGVLRRVSALGRGEDIFSVSFDIEVADDAWSEAIADALADVRVVWADDAVLALPVHLPWIPDGTGEDALKSWTNEVVVHTWDLAVATGQRPSWDDHVLQVAYDTIRTLLPVAEGRGAMFDEMLKDTPPDQRPGAPFADAKPVADDAPLIDKVVAWNGRRP